MVFVVIVGVVLVEVVRQEEVILEEEWMQVDMVGGILWEDQVVIIIEVISMELLMAMELLAPDMEVLMLWQAVADSEEILDMVAALIMEWECTQDMESM